MSDFVTFNQWVKDYGIVEAILRLDFKQKYIVTVDGLPRKVRVFEKDSIYRCFFLFPSRRNFSSELNLHSKIWSFWAGVSAA